MDDMKDTTIQKLAAMIIGGVLAVIFAWQGHTEAAAAIGGALVTYAVAEHNGYKNGVKDAAKPETPGGG